MGGWAPSPMKLNAAASMTAYPKSSEDCTMTSERLFGRTWRKIIRRLLAPIPLAASMLPVVEFLSGSIPGASNQVLYYSLSMGAAMGGNGTLVGAEANLVTAGITEQAGSPISFAEFLKIGLPVTYLTLTVGFLWLLFRFLVLGS